MGASGLHALLAEPTPSGDRFPQATGSNGKRTRREVQGNAMKRHATVYPREWSSRARGQPRFVSAAAEEGRALVGQRWWLQLRIDYDSTAIRPRYDRSTSYVTTGLLCCGLNK